LGSQGFHGSAITDGLTTLWVVQT